MPNPLYALPTSLHLLNGGYNNGDKDELERAAGVDGRVKYRWAAPKSSAIGDEVVINVASYGLFATGRIASRTRPNPSRKNRYEAKLDSIKLIEPAISLATVQRHIPKLGWATYPRSYTTPSLKLAEEIRGLVRQRRKMGMPDLDDAALKSANIDELRAAALRLTPRLATPKKRETIYRTRSKAIRLYVLRRANGHCEGCMAPAPFRGKDGQPFLESHHAIRRADDGPDHLRNVIALCPNCHRRTECSEDARSFNASLIIRLTKLEPSSMKA